MFDLAVGVDKLGVNVAEQRTIRQNFKEDARRPGKRFNIPIEIVANKFRENRQQLTLAARPAEERYHFGSASLSQICRSPSNGIRLTILFMQIAAEFSYRYAKEILQAVAPKELEDIRAVLNNPQNVLDTKKARKQRNYSAQIKNWFVSQKGWKAEQRCKAVPGMKYDLQKGVVCVEIEIGHQRLVFPDFFEFAADHAKQNIAAGAIIVTSDPVQFGDNWHCSLQSTKLKIASVAEWLTVPLFVIAINP